MRRLSPSKYDVPQPTAHASLYKTIVRQKFAARFMQEILLSWADKETIVSLTCARV